MAQVIPIAHVSDVHLARQAAKTMAGALGFDAQTSAEITLVVAELASNLARHTPCGTLTLSAVEEDGRAGLRVESADRGPGITDVEQAIKDGFSTGGSLGYGLGTVNRLMDQFDITSQRGVDAGTTIVCTRWLRRHERALTPCPVEFGVATRPYPGMPVNGDAFVVKRWQASALVALIDGLGHGQYAYRAAQAARHYIEMHFDQPLDTLFRGVGRACRATRGVVMALVRFDFGAQETTFSFASIGNIEVRLFGAANSPSFIVPRGVIGGNAPRARVTEHHWPTGGVMVLHSDGLSSRWSLADFPGLKREPAATMAQRLLRAMAKDNDDATLVIIRDTARER